MNVNVRKNFFKKRHFCKKLYLRNSRRNSTLSTLCLIRPLLKISRFELLKFCEFWNLPIFPDLTNFHLGFKRNRLRLQSLPYLKYFFNFNLLKKIEQIQKIIDFENQYFQWILYKLYPFYCKIDNSYLHNKFISKNFIFRNKAFEYLPKILKYRILHYLFIFFKKKISFLEINCIFKKINK